MLNVIPRFLRTTLLGGVLFLMPIATLAIILDKAMNLALKVAKPVADKLPDDFNMGPARATLLAIVLLGLICFLAGLLARASVAQKLIKGLESSVLSKVPAYEYFKQVTGGMLGFDGLSKHPVVLAQLEGGWQIAVQVEAEINGYVTIFVPDSPNPRTGAVYLMPVDRISPVDAPLGATLNCLKRFGAGANALLQARSSAPTSHS